VYPSATGELIFEVVQEADGGFVTECLTHPIVTQGDVLGGAPDCLTETVQRYFFDSPAPQIVRLHLVRDENFALA